MKRLLFSLLFGFVSCSNIQKHTELVQKNESTKYALVVVGSSRGERGQSLLDPYDKNSFFLAGVYVYQYLKDMGFKEDNIKFLYSTGDPDFEEKLNSATIEDIKREQFGKYDNKATQENLALLTERLSQKVDDNDIFVLYIGTHGSPKSLEMEADKDDGLYYNELQQMLEKINPGMGLVYLDSCYSGAYIKKLDLPRYILVSTTGEHTYSWVDRDFSGGRFFFENLTDPESDKNLDGKISIREAFIHTTKEAKEHMQRIDDYLRTEYNWGRYGSYENVIKSILVEQTMIVGKDASDEFYFIDLHHF